MRRGIALALCGAISWLPLSACGGDDANSQTPVTPSQPPVSTGPTTPSPEDPSPPAMPALATHQSTAGAKAFIGYYVAVLNYSHKAESGRLLRPLATRDCFVCSALALAIDEMARTGGAQRGGEWKILGVAQLSASQETDRNFTLHIQISAGSSRHSSGDATRDIDRRKVFDDVYLTFRQNGWLLKDLRPS